MFPPKTSWNWATSEWQSNREKVSIRFLLYKFITLACAFALTFYLLVNEEKFLLKNECYILWHILWTNGMSYAFTLIQFFASLMIVANTCNNGQVPSLGCCYYFFQLASLVFSSASTLLFWSFCRKLLHESRSNLYAIKCGSCLILTHFDLLIGSCVIKLSHIWVSLFVGVIILLWEIAAKYRPNLKKCVGVNNIDGVLSMEELGENWAALIYKLITLIFLAIGHIFAWCLCKLKIGLHSLCIAKHAIDSFEFL